MSRRTIDVPPALIRLLFLYLVVLACFAAPAFADGPRTMSYQGILTDNGGVALPDGNYGLTFGLYSVAAGGVAFWTETHPAVALSNGGFSVVLGSITPITTAFQNQSWLGVKVGADPELTPRVKLAGAPWALDLALPYSGASSSLQPTMTLVNNSVGPALEVQGTMKVTPDGTYGGEIQVGSPAAPLAVRIAGGTNGGILTGYDESGGSMWDLLADVSTGDGGYFRVYRNGSFANGFVVDGNYLGTGDTQVTIAGDARSAVFNMSAADNASVALPNNAIAAAEMFDEPGVASNADDTVLQITSTTLSPLLPVSITAPASGYLLVMATAQANLVHVAGSDTRAEFGFSNDSTWPANQDFEVAVPPGAGTGTYRFPVTVNTLIPVSQGAHSIYFSGRKVTGIISVEDVHVSAIFVPTAYGTVDPESVASPEISRAGPTRDATAAHEARVERELDAMRTELESLKRYLSSEAATQRVSPQPR